jgi:HEAT repeat protein
MKHARFVPISSQSMRRLIIFAFFLSPAALLSQPAAADDDHQQWADQLQLPSSDGGGKRRATICDASCQLIQNAAYEIAKHHDQFIDNKTVIAKLTDILSDKNRPGSSREVAAFALGSIGPSAADSVPVLIQALESEETTVKRATAEALGRIGSTEHRAIEKLKAMIATDPIEVRIACIEALAKLLPVPDATALLHTQMEYDNVDVRISCMGALFRLNDPKVSSVSFLSTELASKDTKMQRAVTYLLAQHGPDAISAAPALQQLLNRSTDPQVQEVIAWTLGLMGPAASRYAPDLAKLLQNDKEHVGVRRAAADALGSIGSDEQSAVNALTDQLIKNPSLDIKNACATALGGIGNGPRVAAALFSALRESDEPALQLAAASELAKMDPQPNPRISDLVMVSKAADFHLREESLNAIGHIHQQGQIAVPRLIEDMLRDPQPTVRIAAARALGEYGPYLSTDDDMAAKALYALTSACVNGKTHFAASSSLGEIARSLRERFLTSISGKDKILILPLQNAVTDLTNDVSKRSDDVDINSLTSVNQALSSLSRRLSLVSLEGWFAHHPSVLAITYIAIVYLTWLIFLRVVALRYFPLRLLDWAEGLSQFHIRIPEKWGGCEVKVRDLLFLNLFHHSMVLDAWVHKHAETASRAFKDRDVCKGRLTYYPLPLIWNNETISQLTPEHLRQTCQGKRWCLRVVGEGGSGKTSLACQIALWAVEAEPANRLCAHRRMIPVILERGAGPNILGDLNRFTAAIRGQVQNSIGGTSTLPQWFCGELLRDRRILVIVDGLSEMSYESSAPLILEPDFPVAALVVTSRSPTLWAEGVHCDLEPLRIDSNHLLPFMNAYVGKAIRPLADSELYGACKGLADLVGSHRSITPLLAKLYAEQLAKRDPAKTWQNELPENIPDLILGYLNTINRDRGPADPDHATVHKAAEIVAWECCQGNLHAGYAKKARVMHALWEAGLKSDLVEYLEHRLQLVRSIRPAETHIEFALDPLAEYLAALRLVDLLHTDRDWAKFFARADSLALERDSTKDFLRAVRDCCAQAGTDVKISRNTLDRICSRTRVNVSERATVIQ